MLCHSSVYIIRPAEPLFLFFTLDRSRPGTFPSIDTIESTQVNYPLKGFVLKDYYMC